MKSLYDGCKTSSQFAEFLVKIEVSRGLSAIFSSEEAESGAVYILVSVVESAVVVGATPRDEDRKGSDGENNNLRLASGTERLQGESFFVPRA